MDIPEVDIVIPVRNVRDYLSCALDSVVCQTYGNTKAVVVDYGSDDGSEKIIGEYVRKYPGIFRVVTSSDNGISAARNTGVESVTGKYFFFLDADDTLSADAIERLMDVAVSTGADVVLSNFVRSGSGKVNILSSGEVVERSLYQTARYNHTVWGHLFETAVFRIHDLRFREGIIYEDLEIFPRIISSAKKIAHLDSLIYHYRRSRKGSFMNTFTPRHGVFLDVTAEIESRYADDAKMLAAAENRSFAAACNLLRNCSDPEVRKKSIAVVRRLRSKVLRDRKGRAKDRLGALLSYLFILQR